MLHVRDQGVGDGESARGTFAEISRSGTAFRQHFLHFAGFGQTFPYGSRIDAAPRRVRRCHQGRVQQTEPARQGWESTAARCRTVRRRSDAPARAGRSPPPARSGRCDLARAVLCHRTAIAGGIPVDGAVYIAHPDPPRTQPLRLPGVSIVPLVGPPALPGDIQLPHALWMSGPARVLVENVTLRGRPAKSKAGTATVDDRIDELARSGGAGRVVPPWSNST